MEETISKQEMNDMKSKQINRVLTALFAGLSLCVFCSSRFGATQQKLPYLSRFDCNVAP
jgi:hypothetical protein